MRHHARTPAPDDPRVVARRRLLRTLIPPTESTTNARRFAILDTVANGGIEDGVIEHCGPASAAKIRGMSELIASALFQVLCNSCSWAGGCEI